MSCLESDEDGAQTREDIILVLRERLARTSLFRLVSHTNSWQISIPYLSPLALEIRESGPLDVHVP
jgi:hypothetical protein